MQRQRLADQIADVLREQMLTGTLKAGQPLHERETSTALGVSRTPFREAILRLEAEGLVETAPARSPTVANPTLDEIVQLLMVQGALEALAGKLACENATDADIAKISGYYQKMVDETDGPDTVTFFKNDMFFHETIVQSTGNMPLTKIHKQNNIRLWRPRYMSSRSRLGRINTMHDHGQIIQGLQSRDGDKTSQVLLNHLNCAIINVTKIYQASAADADS